MFICFIWQLFHLKQIFNKYIFFLFF
jgi:hypothetical protein